MGGKDMFHCMKCNVCMNVSLKDHHICIPDLNKAECPICLEKIFIQTHDIQRLKCGHVMHRNCYDKLIENQFRCPTCRRSAYDMKHVWQKYDQINMQFESEIQNNQSYN